MRTVGIDLTGSEKRKSGWALLEGMRTTTGRIGSDNELIEATKAANPDVVSIDSPLTLPEIQGKIYRECELELKRRHIGVFWCLLPSMRELTFRGIALANRLRAIEIPTIESYPGAAQVVLGMPRKKEGSLLLADALRRYGVLGNLDVSHDELDAVTAALVGQLYLTGRYERLGSLIMPLREES